MTRHIIIGGGSGFIGSALTAVLRKRGDRVTWISRTPGPARITWDDLRGGLPPCDAVVNLAGQHILDMTRRWTPAYAEEVVASRVETTRLLVHAINASARPPAAFVSTAGKCFYGTGEIGASRHYPDLDEDAEPMGVDYPAEMVARWEAAANEVDATRLRHVQVRIGVVLGAVRRASTLGRLWRIGRTRGILPVIRLPFCLGVGCRIGRGWQPMPWVHVEDVVGILLHALDRPIDGRLNAVAPGIVTSDEFIGTFARHLRRPIVWRAPIWLVRRIVGGERASILLEGQRVRPRRTIETGYAFRFPTLDRAFDDLVEVTV